MYNFNASLLEVIAQLSWTCPQHFIWLLDQCDTAMSTGLLLSAVGFHEHFHKKRGKNNCALKKILSGEADPNAVGYYVTPIQIAVAARNIEGVRELLEAGAESNATGDRNGISFKPKSILEWANELQGLSPLHICCHVKRDPGIKAYRDEMTKKREDNNPVIEALLIQHGTKEFTSLPR